MSLLFMMGSLATSGGAGGGSGIPTDPNPVTSGLVGDIDFSDASTMTLSGTDILTITDKVNSIVGTTVNGTNRPQFDSTYFKDTRGAAVFAGSTSANAIDFGTPTEWAFAPTDPYTVITVAYCNGTDTGTIFSKAQQTIRQTYLFFDATTFKGVSGGAATLPDAGGNVKSRGKVLGLRSNGTQAQTINKKTYGALQNVETNSTVAKWLAGARWGTANADLAYPLTGAVGRTLIYNRALSDVEYNNVVDWLMGIYSADFQFIMFGASLMQYSTAETDLANIANAQYKIDLPTVINRGIAGEDIADMDFRIATEVSTYGSTGAYWFIHAGGNDVTNTRPYSGVVQGVKDGWISDLTNIADSITASGGILIPASLTFRDYSDTTAANQEAGSLPYNRDLFMPFWKTKAPDWFFSGTEEPLVQLYYWMLNDYATYLSGDNVHPTPTGYAAMKQFIVDTAIKKIVSGVNPTNLAP